MLLLLAVGSCAGAGMVRVTKVCKVTCKVTHCPEKMALSNSDRTAAVACATLAVLSDMS